jgi:type III secretory pathway component EscT
MENTWLIFPFVTVRVLSVFVILKPARTEKYLLASLISTGHVVSGGLQIAALFWQAVGIIRVVLEYSG